MSEEIFAIAELLTNSFQHLDQIKVFAFGTAIFKENTNDIDILIIYDDQSHPPKLRALLENFGYQFIHLIFLTSQEEIETDFIRTQNCLSIL